MGTRKSQGLTEITKLSQVNYARIKWNLIWIIIHDIAEILLKMTLNTINQSINQP
jgi:hypothetical protein